MKINKNVPEVWQPQGHRREESGTETPQLIYFNIGEVGNKRGRKAEFMDKRGRDRKLIYKTDGIAYQGVDGGCAAASKYLGKPSNCFECPFADCLIDYAGTNRPYRNTIKELAKK